MPIPPRFPITRTKLLLLTGVFFLLISLGCQQEKKNIGLQLGDTAPDFAAKDLNDRVIVLSSLKGSPVILRFIETTCRFCRADTPVFTNIYTQNKEDGPQILYVGSFYEKKDVLRSFAIEFNIDFPILTDTESKIADLYDIRVYPQTLFIGPDQKILASLLGGVGEAEIMEILGKFIKSSISPPVKTP